LEQQQKSESLATFDGAATAKVSNLMRGLWVRANLTAVVFIVGYSNPETGQSWSTPIIRA
jgi:hypothetical protein